MCARVAASLLALCLGLGLSSARADAAGSIGSFTKLCVGSISFTVVDITNSRLPGSQSCSFSLKIKTTANAGSVTLLAPSITGGTGAISQTAYWAQCTATSDPGGIFSSNGLVQLGSSAITCATIPAHSNNTVQFDVTLFLDDTGDATAFPSDAAYAPANLAVTANAP